MILIISLLCLFFSYRLFRYAAGSMRFGELNMVSWIFYYDLFLQSFLGSLLIVYSIDDHYVINTLPYESLRFWGWIIIMYTLITLPLGMCFAAKILHISPRIRFHEYVTKPMMPFLSSKDSYVKWALYAFSALGALALFYVFSYSSSVPFFDLFKGKTALELAQARISISRDFKGSDTVKNLLALFLIPFLTYIAYAYWRMTRSKVDFLWFILLLLLAFLALTYNYAKAPFLMFLLGLLFADILISGKKSLKKLFFVFISLALILLFFYIFIMQPEDILKLFSIRAGIGGRLILGQIAGLFKALEYFPFEVDFIGFDSFSMLFLKLLDFDFSERSARIIMGLFNPRGIELGTAGVMNSLFVAEAWANWGIIGVLLSPFWVGFIVEIVYLILLKRPKTPLYLGILAFLSLKWPITGGVNDFIINQTIVYTLMFLFLFLVSSFFLKNALGKKHTFR